jgi:glucose/arabinose dehydrogenase
MTRRSLLSLLTLALCALPALAQPTAAPPAPDTLQENFLAEHEIGRRFHIDPAQLPAPKSSPIVTNRPLTLPVEGHVPQVPPGFQATRFASGLTHPRRLLVLPNGDVLVAEQSAAI